MESLEGHRGRRSGARSSWSLEQAAQGDNVSLLARALQRDSTDEAGRGGACARVRVCTRVRVRMWFSEDVPVGRGSAA